MTQLCWCRSLLSGSCGNRRRIHQHLQFPNFKALKLAHKRINEQFGNIHVKERGLVFQNFLPLTDSKLFFETALMNFYIK